MFSWIEEEFAERLFIRYDRYEKVSTNPFRLNARCPICGDSQRDAYKARFWCYYPPKNDNGLRVHCFNCDYSSGFSYFLKEQDEPMFREMMLEVNKRKQGGRKRRPTTAPEPIVTEVTSIPTIPLCVRVDKLKNDHPIVRYLNNRCIHGDMLERFYFTTRWHELVNTVKPDSYDFKKDEARLVIPIFNKKGEIESFQGRTLKKHANSKYITIKISDDSTKLYGTDRVNEEKPVLIVEGPIDSMFLDNCIAITGGTMDLQNVPYKNNRIWVMDNEPRSIDTTNRIKKLIEAGERVLIWDKCRFTQKDINAMIQHESATKEELMDYIINNSCSGMMAKLRLSKFSKV